MIWGLLFGLAGALVANALLAHNRLVARLERRRQRDVAQGGQPPPLRGVSGHERADIQTELHRMSLMTRRERWIMGAQWWAIPVVLGLAAWSLF